MQLPHVHQDNIPSNHENEKRSSNDKGTDLIINEIPHAFHDLICVKENKSALVQEEEQQTRERRYNALNRDGGGGKRKVLNRLDQSFVQAFHPTQMRCLALVSHNEMKASMKKFVLANKTILKKFRLTGTNSTMTMLREVFKGDDSVIFGPSCSSGPLGGDAELVALMCAGELGGVIFFQDPMSSHPHQADIDCLCRQAVVHNTMMASNPTSALMMMTTLRCALKENMPELIPSFFCTLQSPSVSEYTKQQNKVIASHSNAIVTPNLQGAGAASGAGDQDDEPSVAHRIANHAPAAAPAASSLRSRSEVEKVTTGRSRSMTKLVQTFTLLLDSMGGQINEQPSRSIRFASDESTVNKESTTSTTLARKPRRSLKKFPLLCR
jgi:methylglyoxal synthase